jgi:hypothetical protein
MGLPFRHGDGRLGNWLGWRIGRGPSVVARFARRFWVPGDKEVIK